MNSLKGILRYLNYKSKWDKRRDKNNFLSKKKKKGQWDRSLNFLVILILSYFPLVEKEVLLSALVRLLLHFVKSAGL